MEILYFQAGSLANFVGTHFWNTQESYFTYGEDDDSIVHHDRSFREGLNAKGEQTYCPRVLLFDRKLQFGALSNDLYRSEDIPDLAPWEDGIVEYRQDPIPKSEYQTRLDEGEVLDDAEDNKDDIEQRETDTSRIRFWSDYARVYFHPRSMHRLPDPPDWEVADGDWNKSREDLRQYESERDLMDNEVRLFVEECDGLQGIQLINECATFGGFTDAFLTTFRDEHHKVPSLAFPLLSSASSAVVSLDEQQETMKALNDALCLRSLENLSTINIPLQNPSTWRRDEWLEGLNQDIRSPYLTSAILSTHIESVTLPLRLKDSLHDFSSISGLLNPSGITHTVHLAGMYPIATSVSWSPEVKTRIYDLSAATIMQDRMVRAASTTEYHARLHVTRGFTPSERPQYDELFSTCTPEPISIHVPAYPTPTSFPRFQSDRSPLTYNEASRHRVLSTLTTSSASASLFASYARLAQECADRRAEVVTRMGLEFDEVRELKDELWALCDAYAGEDGGEVDASDEELGEDEE